MPEENKTSSSNPIPPDAKADVQSGAAHARKAADDLKSAAGTIADDFKSAAGAMAGEYRERAEEVWNDARFRAHGFQEDGEQYVRDNPTKAVLTALGVGFVLGLIFRR